MSLEIWVWAACNWHDSSPWWSWHLTSLDVKWFSMWGRRLSLSWHFTSKHNMFFFSHQASIWAFYKKKHGREKVKTHNTHLLSVIIVIYVIITHLKQIFPTERMDLKCFFSPVFNTTDFVWWYILETVDFLDDVSLQIPFNKRYHESGGVALSREKNHNIVNCFSYVCSRAQSILALGRTTQSPAYLVINVHIYLEKKRVLERLMLPISF